MHSLKKAYFFIILFFFVLFTSLNLAQTSTNLDVLYQLADSSIGLLNNTGSTGASYCLKVNNSGQFAVFNNTIFKTADARKLAVCKENQDSVISYSLEKATINYPVMFRDGFLGKHMVQRTARLEGTYFSPSEGYKKFNISFSDSVAVNEIRSLENEALPFTKGELPSEPFFSGILEPVAAITTAAAIIVLYFTVRSK